MHSEHKRVTKPHGMEHGKVLRHGAGVQIFEWGQGRCGKGTAAGQAGVFAFASLHLFLTTEQFVINHHGLLVLDEPSSIRCVGRGLNMASLFVVYLCMSTRATAPGCTVGQGKAGSGTSTSGLVV